MDFFVQRKHQERHFKMILIKMMTMMIIVIIIINIINITKSSKNKKKTILNPYLHNPWHYPVHHRWLSEFGV